MTTRNNRKGRGTKKIRHGGSKVSKTKMSRDKLDEFSHFFVTYINQIFGDRSVRAILYKLFGNQPHNKNLRFGLVAFHRYQDPSDEWVEANENKSVLRADASYYDDKIDKVKVEDTDDNHHVLYDVKNKKYIDSVNTEGMKYQDQERDENDSLCQSYTLMFFFDFELDNDPVEKQMQIIGMYDWLLKQKPFLKELKNDLFFRKPMEDEHWNDENERILPTQGKIDFDYLIHRIKDTLRLWEKYGYWHFIGEGDEIDVEYDINDYGLESIDDE